MTEKLTLNPKQYYFEYTPLKRPNGILYNIFINATKEKWTMNPSFDFYIVDISRGDISGTNDSDIAKQLGASDDFYVIDVKNNIDLLDNSNIEEYK